MNSLFVWHCLVIRLGKEGGAIESWKFFLRDDLFLRSALYEELHWRLYIYKNFQCFMMVLPFGISLPDVFFSVSAWI